MLSKTNIIYHQKILRVLHISMRQTSAGPPISQPPTPGSFSDRYDKFIGRWPRVQALHRKVVDGSRWCYSDIKTYLRVNKELKSGKKLNEFSMSELEVLVQIPAEGPKLVIVLTLLPLPFTVYIIGFAIIFFPRFVLTRHFWTDQQRKDFFLQDIKKSMETAKNNARHLEKYHANREIGSASFDSVMTVSRFHGFLPISFFNVKKRLKRRADYLKALDQKLIGNLDDLSSQQLYFHMYIRRLTYSGLSDNDIKRKLKTWISTSSAIEGLDYLMAPYRLNRQ